MLHSGTVFSKLMAFLLTSCGVFARGQLNTGSVSQEAYVKASNTQLNDRFGFSTSISGETLVVGAWLEDSSAFGTNGNQQDNGAQDSGAAYVYLRNNGSWSQDAYLKASNASAFDNFAYSVAVSEDTVVVGAPFEDSASNVVNGNELDESSPNSGAAYVFERVGGAWVQTAYLKASNSNAGDVFGFSVAVSGDVIAVSAWHEDSGSQVINGNQLDNGSSAAGAVYVFRRVAGAWAQEAYLKASNAQTNDTFGYSLAVSGDTIVVGAFGEDSSSTGVNGFQGSNSSNDSGAAYVFTRDAFGWSQQAYLKASNTGASDGFGHTVAVSGDTVVVGARLEASGATGVNGNQLDNSQPASGAAYVFERNGSVWAQTAYLKASNTKRGNAFAAYGVAVSGHTIVIGADSEQSASTGVNGSQVQTGVIGAGAAYVFTRYASGWGQAAYLKASNTGGNDQFGYSVGVHGSTAVVAAPAEASAATGVNGDQQNNAAYGAGAVYVFDLGSVAGPITYCTSGTTTNGCTPSISGVGFPSASSSAGFTIHLDEVEGDKSGVVFYGIGGSSTGAWGSGGTSLLCVKAPLQRMGAQSAGGAAGTCEGSFAEDWNAFISSHPSALGQPFAVGETVWAQGWFRDPPAPKTTSLSNGLAFTVGP